MRYIVTIEKEEQSRPLVDIILIRLAMGVGIIVLVLCLIELG